LERSLPLGAPAAAIPRGLPAISHWKNKTPNTHSVSATHDVVSIVVFIAIFTVKPYWCLDTGKLLGIPIQ
jgi:hypothetical protein